MEQPPGASIVSLLGKILVTNYLVANCIYHETYYPTVNACITSNPAPKLAAPSQNHIKFQL